MTVSFDAGTGRLRIDQPAFDRLVEWANGNTTEGPRLDELRRAGVVFQEATHPVLDPVLRTVTDYLCELRVDMIDHNGEERSGDGWIGRDGAVLLLDLPGGQRDLHSLAAELLPAAIARLTRLGPHPVTPGDPLPMTRDVFESLLAATEADRRAAADRLILTGEEAGAAALVERLVAGPWRRWTAAMAWYTPDGEPATSTLQVLDTDACLCLCEVSGIDAVLWPTNATEVWRRLTLLLPDEVEGG